MVVAGLLKDGTVRDALLNAADIGFSAPSYLKKEVSRHLGRVAARAQVPVATAEAILEDLLGVIDLVPPGVYSPWMDVARGMALRAGALGDEDYLALALALKAPIWTLDKDSLRLQGLRVLSTKDLEGT